MYNSSANVIAASNEFHLGQGGAGGLGGCNRVVGAASYGLKGVVVPVLLR